MDLKDTVGHSLLAEFCLTIIGLRWDLIMLLKFKYIVLNPPCWLTQYYQIDLSDKQEAH